jgi:molybdopterin synthase sulfur carrier subunit
VGGPRDGGGGVTASGTVRYWAAAKAAAGVAEEPYTAETVAELVQDAGRRHGSELQRVLARSTFLVDGVRRDSGFRLPDGGVVEVLPPFAGG